MQKRERIKYTVLGVLAIVTFFVWYAVVLETRGEKLTVTFLDIGQGDAIFIDAPSGNQILVDGGANKKILSELGKVMPFFDRSIDMVISTHPDKDHLGGLPWVLEKYKVARVLEPGVKGASAEYTHFKSMIEKQGIEREIANRGMHYDLGGGAFLTILFPDRDVSGLETNDASIVAKLTYGNTSYLMTGDSPQKIEEYLVSLGASGLNSDVLKVGHHGSRTSTGEKLIAAVSPSIAVISAGKNNRYGHPHKEVLEILNKFGVKILGTYDHSGIKTVSDGASVKVR